MTSYPPKTQMVVRTAFPNGDVITYENGMPQYRLLQSNHPHVLKMKARRTSNQIRSRKLKIA